MKSVKYSVTERGSWKRCLQQWDYGSFNRQGLTPRAAGMALTSGTIHHKTMDIWCKHILAQKENNLLADFNPSEGVDLVSAEVVHEIAAKYKREVGVKINRVELDPVFEAIEFERPMIKNYADYWGSPVEDGFELLQSEQTIVIPVCQAPCAVCDGSGNIAQAYGFAGWVESCLACDGEGLVQLEIEGTLDALLSKDNRLYVAERKTYDKRPSLDYLRFFDQGTVYVWMVQQLHIGEVAGIAYDGAWRRKVPPKGSVMSDLFLRTLLLRTPYELERMGQQLVHELRAMNNTTVFPNRRWEGCYDCGYRKLCDADTLGEDSESIKQRYYTLRDRTPAFVTAEET